MSISQRALGAAPKQIDLLTALDYAAEITACWRQSVDAILEVGRLLNAAKDGLPHGDFLRMMGDSLPFGARTAQRLMALGKDARLRAHASHLPASWATLYELTKLKNDQFEARILDGTIRPEMERRDISQLLKREARASRESDLASKISTGNLSLPTKRYGVILADPEWRFEPWSRATGMDRAADNHYPTSVTEVIAARDVASVAAKDAVLFLWATGPMIREALMVMDAWGFTYKSQMIWGKPQIGTGYWFREQHELLLVGTRGSPVAPAMGTQPGSLLMADRTQHSAKPVEVYQIIERWYPNIPKIELNARAARSNWDSWGLDAPEHDHDTGEITEAAE